MSILKIVLYVLPFVVAIVVGWFALGIGLTGGLPTDVSPITMANILVVAAILIIALNVGWIVAYNRR